jgi:UDPglucose--hexose-1-phosphate uridylyltransferase
LAFSPFSEGNEGRTPPEVFSNPADRSRSQYAWLKVRVVTKKFPVLSIEGDVEVRQDGASEWMEGVGIHEIVVESPDPVKDLADLGPDQVSDLFRAC